MAMHTWLRWILTGISLPRTYLVSMAVSRQLPVKIDITNIAVNYRLRLIMRWSILFENIRIGSKSISLILNLNICRARYMVL